MVKMFLVSLLLLAQGPPATTGTTADTAVVLPPKISYPLPFKSGETLIYEVDFSKLIFRGKIGELKFWVADDGTTTESSFIDLQAEAVSKGFFSKLFGLKVRDRFKALVSPVDFGLNKSTKLIEEGKVRREQQSVIDREAGQVTYTDRDLAVKSAEPKIKKAASPSWVQDVLSSCYYIRTRDLKAGEVIPVSISDGGKVYNIEVVVVGKREQIKVDAGNFNTILLDAKIFDGRYIKRSGELKLWVTDDERRIPVRARVKTSGVTVTIGLKSVEHAVNKEEGSATKSTVKQEKR